MRIVLLIDHGSHSPEANQVLEDLAGMVRASAGLPVRTAHLQWAKPDIATAVKACVEAGASELVVVPVFLAPGKHSTRDIPAQLQAAARGYPQVRIFIAPPLGPHPKIAQVIVERFAEVRRLGE